MGWRNLCKEILNSSSSSMRTTRLITVNLDHKVDHGRMVEIIDEARKAGVPKIDFAAKSKS